MLPSMMQRGGSSLLPPIGASLESKKEDYCLRDAVPWHMLMPGWNSYFLPAWLPSLPATTQPNFPMLTHATATPEVTAEYLKGNWTEYNEQSVNYRDLSYRPPMMYKIGDVTNPYLSHNPSNSVTPHIPFSTPLLPSPDQKHSGEHIKEATVYDKNNVEALSRGPDFNFNDFKKEKSVSNSLKTLLPKKEPHLKQSQEISCFEDQVESKDNSEPDRCSSTSETKSPERPYLKFGVRAILSQGSKSSPSPNTDNPSAHRHFSFPTYPANKLYPPLIDQSYQFHPDNQYLGYFTPANSFPPSVGHGMMGAFPWFPSSVRGKSRRGMLRRAVFSDSQRKSLEMMFQQQKYIGKPDRKKLAGKLGLKDSQVKIWFQNRRMKWRNSKERDMMTSTSTQDNDDDIEVHTSNNASTSPPDVTRNELMMLRHVSSSPCHQSDDVFESSTS